MSNHTSSTDILGDIFDILAQNGSESILDRLQSQDVLNMVEFIDYEQGFIQFNGFRLQIIREGNE